MRAVVLRFALGGLLVVPAAAIADRREVTDGENPDQVVDVMRATHDHHGRHSVAHDFVAAEAWFGQDLNELRLYVRALGDSRTERLVTVRPTGAGDTFTAVVRDGKGKRIGDGRVERTGDRAVRLVVAKRLLGTRVRSYRWWAVVVAACRPREPGGLCGGPKHDRVPDAGTIGHRLVPR
jgi:hypothetical protein